MNRREAKQRVCNAVAHIMSMSSQGPGEWLYQDDDGSDLSPADVTRMEEAFEELMDELRRRGGEEA